MNRITNVTRRNIVDELISAKIWYNGRLAEPDFLSRIYDLKNYRREIIDSTMLMMIFINIW